jgi:chromosome segregation ATPase
MANLKLQARLSDSQNMIEQLSQKLVQLEKRKGQLQDEETDMSVMLDQAQVLNSTMEKKAKQYDRIVGEWKHKVDGLSMELHIAQNETCNVSGEKMPMKNPCFN